MNSIVYSNPIFEAYITLSCLVDGLAVKFDKYVLEIPTFLVSVKCAVSLLQLFFTIIIFEPNI